jgi:hypothetical protein
MVGGRIKLQNEELHNLYSLSNIIRMIKSRRMRWEGHVECMVEDCIKDFGENAKGKKPQGEPRRRRDDNIKTVLIEIGWGVLDWIDLARERNQWKALVDTVMNLRVL